MLKAFVAIFIARYNIPVSFETIDNLFKYLLMLQMWHIHFHVFMYCTL